MRVKTVEADADIERVAAVLLELRPAFDRSSLVARIKEQMAQGYHVAYVEEAGEVLCVAGFVVGMKLAWGKHIYVDDLVTAAKQRSRGAGRMMIDWL
mgnify:CR=1 FL=1